MSESKGIKDADYSGTCHRCGSARWVSISLNGGRTRIPQCVPCGAYHRRNAMTTETHQCEACGHSADDLIEHEGAFFCPSLQRCDYNANIGWINADIQAGIDAEMRRVHDGAAYTEKQA